jgi:hypothetical protein
VSHPLLTYRHDGHVAMKRLAIPSARQHGAGWRAKAG